MDMNAHESFMCLAGEIAPSCKKSDQRKSDQELNPRKPFNYLQKCLPALLRVMSKHIVK